MTIIHYDWFNHLIQHNDDILKVMGKDAEFLYAVIDTYIKDANNEHKQHMADTWNKIKQID